MHEYITHAKKQIYGGSTFVLSLKLSSGNIYFFFSKGSLELQGVTVSQTNKKNESAGLENQTTRTSFRFTRLL